MKKYLAFHLIVKLGIIVCSSVSALDLQGSISESLDRNKLLEDWNKESSVKSIHHSTQTSSGVGYNQLFFPIESDLPATQNKSTQPAQLVSDEAVLQAAQDFEKTLKESLSHHENNQRPAVNDKTIKKSEISHQSVFDQATNSVTPASLTPADPIKHPLPLESSANQQQSNFITQAEPTRPVAVDPKPGSTFTPEDKTQPILIRFNNVSIIEYLRFISGISHKNFIFDENDLQFNITMISEEPTSIDDFMTALLQELRIHDLTLLEQGNNLVIHKNPKVNNISTVLSDESADKKTSYELVTQVFRLNTADAEKVAAIIRPLISERAIIEVIKDTNHIILTDLTTNVIEIGKLIRTIDSPHGGLVIGQYVVRTNSIDAILPIVQQLMGPISADQSIQYVPYTPANSIFIVSTPFLVERALSILQHLDQNQKSTKIFNLKDFQYQNNGSGTGENGEDDGSDGQGGRGGKASQLPPAGIYINGEAYDFQRDANSTVPNGFAGESGNGEGTNGFGRSSTGPTGNGTDGKNSGWKLDNQGNWTFKVFTQQGQAIDPNHPPTGKWTLDQRGNWLFVPGAIPSASEEQNQPHGNWEVDPAGNWEFDLDKGESISINVITRSAPEREELLPGSKPKGQFFLHKVHYRKGEELQRSLAAMSDSIRETDNIDPDLVNALASVQWLESSNSLVFSGTPEALKKISVLIDEIDIPLRQVFIEMLILEAALVDALNYSVKWGNRFAGGNWAGADGFDSTFPSPLSSALNSAGTNNLGQPIQLNAATGLPILGQVFVPNPTPFNGTPGFDIGIIGQRIFNKLTGIEFESIGAFINCLRAITTSNIILNPKIITEDGVPAEIFVGENIAYQTQSIVNDQGVILTSNFEYRDVGTRLKVTPYLGATDIIALEIENEITNVITNAQAGLPANSNVGPNTTKSSTVTRVHIPSGFFLVISGMLRDETRRTDAHAPCLGGIPILGAAFKDKKYEDQKRNLMIFIQPRIIDTDEDMQCLTKHQQDLLKFKNRRKRDMLYETEEFMDFLNLKKYDHQRTSIEFEDDEDPL